MSLETINPAALGEARGYSNGVVGTGRTLYVAGQIGWDADHTFSTDDLVDQFGKALDAVIAVVRAAGGAPEDVARMTVYVTSLDEYRHAGRRLGQMWRERFGTHYPAMALVGVAGLVEPLAKVEVEAVACLGDAT